MNEWPEFNLPNIREMTPSLKLIDLTVAQVKAMPDAELLGLLSGEGGHDGILALPLQQLILSELHARSLASASKPHWSVVPSFWLLVITAFLALVAAIAAMLALPQIQALLHLATTN